MSACNNKRGRELETLSAKRGRVEHIARLADLRFGADAFVSKYNAARAKEKGILRSREASGKYEEVRPCAVPPPPRSHRHTNPRPARPPARRPR